MDEVAVGAVQLDPVEAGVDRVAGGRREVGDGLPDLVAGQFARGGEVRHARAGEEPAGRPDR
ncbi:hypothetical protein GCM10009647_064790 [Streptomyces sanglieri]